jgi:F-type H+-transporting ATPase subunit epsilon
MSAPLQLKIVMPEAAIPPRDIQGINVPAADGRLTVLAGHQPLVVALVRGNAVITALDGTRETWAISDGALQVEANTAILLVSEATRQLDQEDKQNKQTTPRDTGA